MVLYAYRKLMEFVAYGTQYRQNPHVWGVPLTPVRAKHPLYRLQHEKRASRLAPGQKRLPTNSVFRQSRWAATSNTIVIT